MNCNFKLTMLQGINTLTTDTKRNGKLVTDAKCGRHAGNDQCKKSGGKLKATGLDLIFT